MNCATCGKEIKETLHWGKDKNGNPVQIPYKQCWKCHVEFYRNMGHNDRAKEIEDSGGWKTLPSGKWIMAGEELV